MEVNIPVYNAHCHRKPQSKEEVCVRNSFLLKSPIQAPPYYLSVGVHPWHVHKWEISEAIAKLAVQIKTQGVLAIGEIGLDKLALNYQKQIKLFEAQLDLAQSENLPVVLHIVKAGADVAQIIKGFNQPIILHGFNQPVSVWEMLNRNNQTYVSVGPAILGRNKKILDLAINLPNEKLLMETDNFPIKIQEIYRAMCAIKNKEYKELATQVEMNFKQAYPLINSSYSPPENPPDKQNLLPLP